MLTALAALPPALVLALLLARVPPLAAAAVALTAAVLVASTAFSVDPVALASAAAAVSGTAAEVTLIVAGGVLLNALLDAGGAQQALGRWLADSCRDPTLAVLLVVLGITPFAESVTGFGVGVVVAVPLLRSIGFASVPAAVLALLGLVTVPWGALGPGTLVAAELTGVAFSDLSSASAALSLPVFLLVGGAALTVATGRAGLRRGLSPLALVAGALWVGVLGSNLVLGTPVAGALGGLLSSAVTLLLARRRAPLHRPGPAVRRALLPYAVLLGGLLSSRALLAAAGGGTVEDGHHSWPAAVSSSPAAWLLLTCALTPLLLGRAGILAPALRGAGRRAAPVAATTALFLLLGATMTASGMSTALASGAGALGRPYLLLAPWVGGLGGLLTGSNVGANAMFAASQAAAAQALDVPLLPLLAVQNVSASLLTMASAPRVALAAGLAFLPSKGLPGPLAPVAPGPTAGAPREAVALITRRVLVVDALVLAALGVLALIGLTLGDLVARGPS